MGIKIKLAVCVAKFINQIIQKTERGRGTALPGRVAEWIAPDLLSELSGMVREKIIVTMGTNGKTTTNNLLCQTLEAEGKKVVCNRLGANMKSGIAAAFALATKRDGSLDADYACIEVDELAADAVLPQLCPNCIVLTNIFRDQLDRYGEIDIICRKIKEAIQKVPEAVLVINSDDIFSYALACECRHPVVLYGIEENAFHDMASEGFPDSLFCRFCGKRLSYDFFHYGHLGSWHCSHCSAKRPLPVFTARDVCFDGDGCSFCLVRNRAAIHAHPQDREAHLQRPLHEIFCLGKQRFTAQTKACYSIYNIIAAYTALYAAEAEALAFQETVRSFDYGNQREEKFFINGATVQLYLAKNPVGFQQKLAMLKRDSSKKDIIIQINDNAQDGKDVSWLWDVDFGGFAGLCAVTVLTAGLRRYDMQLRLKYEDIPCEAADNIEMAVEQLTKKGTKNLYVISNYSGLYEANQMLRRLQGD